MGRMVDTDDLVDRRAISDLLNVHYNSVGNWMSGRVSPPFPEPLKVLGKTFVWDWNDIDAWYKRYVEANIPSGQKRGRKPQTVVQNGRWHNT